MTEMTNKNWVGVISQLLHSQSKSAYSVKQQPHCISSYVICTALSGQTCHYDV